LKHRATVRAVPAQNRAQRILADDRDTQTIGVCLANGLQCISEAIRSGREVEHAGVCMPGEFIQRALECSGIIGLTVATRPVVASRVAPAWEWACEFLVIRTRSRPGVNRNEQNDRNGSHTATLFRVVGAGNSSGTDVQARLSMDTARNSADRQFR